MERKGHGYFLIRFFNSPMKFSGSSRGEKYFKYFYNLFQHRWVYSKWKANEWRILKGKLLKFVLLFSCIYCIFPSLLVLLQKIVNLCLNMRTPLPPPEKSISILATSRIHWPYGNTEYKESTPNKLKS